MPPPPSAPGPEFFGAAQPAPPTRPYEAPFAGPQISRESFQPAGEAPLPPAAYTTAPVPPAAPAAPGAPAGAPPTAAPSWVPGYTAPGGEVPGAPPAAQPAAAQPPAGQPPAAQPAAYYPAPEAAAPAYAAPAFPPAAPETLAPPASPVPPAAPVAPEPPVGDPFGSLFEAESADTAARLASAAPPSTAPPASDDPMASLFGGLAETSEGPVVPAGDLFASTPPVAAAPVYTPEPAFAVPPEAPAAPVPAPEPAYVPAAPAAAPASAPGSAPYRAAPPPADDPTAGTQFFGGGEGSYDEPPNLDKTTVGEKVAFALAFVVPPAGLIASIVAAAQSARRRGWVHGFVRAGLVISVVTTIIAGIGGGFAYKAFDDAQKHDALEAASAQFCATVAEQPDMITPPTLGFPGPGASIQETVDSIQAFIDKWDALAAVSPSGIRPGVARVSNVAGEILDSIEKIRLVDNEANIANMTAVAQSSGVIEWHDEYCS